MRGLEFVNFRIILEYNVPGVAILLIDVPLTFLIKRNCGDEYIYSLLENLTYIEIILNFELLKMRSGRSGVATASAVC